MQDNPSGLVYNPARRGPGRPSARWLRWKEQTDLAEYDARWEHIAASGQPVHGEVDLTERFLPASGSTRVLDAGCGLGRVAVELARRGYQVVGVDNDPEMLQRARPKSADVEWLLADLSSVRFKQPFDAIVMAGNVLVYAEPSRRHLVVPNLARALVNGGCLITGTGFAPGFDLGAYESWCELAGLHPVERYASWDGDAFVEGGRYAVCVHVAYDATRRS